MTSIASKTSSSTSTRQSIPSVLSSLRKSLKEGRFLTAPEPPKLSLTPSPYYVTSTMPSAPLTRTTTPSRPNATTLSSRNQSRGFATSPQSQPSDAIPADDDDEEPSELMDLYYWTEPPTLAYSTDPPSYAYACGGVEGHSSRKYETLKAIAKSVSNEIFNGGKSF